jgi:hypothetical protein
MNKYIASLGIWMALYFTGRWADKFANEIVESWHIGFFSAFVCCVVFFFHMELSKGE